MRLLLALALLLPVVALADPAFRSSATQSATSAGSRTCAEPAGAADGDVLLAFVTMSDDAGKASTAWDVPSGWLEVVQGYTDDAAMTDIRYSVQYRVRSGDTGSTVWTYGDGTSYLGASRCTIAAYSGVVGPFDVPYDDHIQLQINATNITTGWIGGAPAPIDVTSDDALVVLIQFLTATSSSGTYVSPSGYADDVEQMLTNRSHMFASKLVSAGTETPGAWDHIDISSNADAVDFTLALRSAAINSAARIRR